MSKWLWYVHSVIRVMLQTSFRYMWLGTNLVFNFLLVPTASLICLNRILMKIQYIKCFLYHVNWFPPPPCVFPYNFWVSSCMCVCVLLYHGSAFGSFFFFFSFSSVKHLFFYLCHISFSLPHLSCPLKSSLLLTWVLFNHYITSCWNLHKRRWSVIVMETKSLDCIPLSSTIGACMCKG